MGRRSKRDPALSGSGRSQAPTGSLAGGRLVGSVAAALASVGQRAEQLPADHCAWSSLARVGHMGMHLEGQHTCQYMAEVICDWVLATGTKPLPAR